MAFKCMTGQAPEYPNLLPVSKLANEQLGVVKSLTSLFSELPPDREPFITGLLNFETIWHLFLS